MNEPIDEKSKDIRREDERKGYQDRAAIPCPKGLLGGFLSARDLKARPLRALPKGAVGSQGVGVMGEEPACFNPS